MREIKFKAWLPGISKMTYAHTLEELMNWDTKKEDNGTAIWLQWTGRHDKNGKEIYEGDRFRSHKSAGKSVGTIEYIEDGFKVVWDEPNYGCLNNILRIHAEDGEVIGDIYETPEKV